MGDSAALDETLDGEISSADQDSFSQSQEDLNNAIEELSGLGDSDPAPQSSPPSQQSSADASDLIWDLPVDVNIVLGTTQLSVARLMALEQGEVVELNRRIGEPLDITVNGRKVAKGEIVMREDDKSKFAIQIVEIVGR
ncbi:MAG: flagellar motor switch protein FliN [Rhizobiaceae bacterium]|nr:flagellar motor switch protein FliN [Rhizobiaceae bacterium]